MLSIPGGTIVVRDEGTRRSWSVDLEPFLLAPHPVTRATYLRDPETRDPNLPVTEISWLDAVRYCEARSLRDGLTPAMRLGDDPDALDATLDPSAHGWRLPTEAEWEYACLAGSEDARPGALDEIAWHRGNSGERVHPVGQLQPNAWGLHDMIGNVWEWCWDLFDTEVYGGYRVFRGGGWCDVPRSLRSSCRRKSHPTFRIDDLGFRLARSTGPR